MDKYIIILLGISIAFFLGTLGYTILSLIYSWLQLKFIELEIWKDKIL